VKIISAVHDIPTTLGCLYLMKKRAFSHVEWASLSTTGRWVRRPKTRPIQGKMTNAIVVGQIRVLQLAPIAACNLRNPI
jgi:hypothetical protein